MAKVNLSEMTVEALMDLRKRVDEMLLEHRAEIEERLKRMDRAIAVVGGARVVGYRPSVRAWFANEGVLNMHVAIFITVVAIVVGFAAPTCANDRPSDPFGNHTIELNKDTPLVEMWESLKDQVLLDRAHFRSCIESN